MPGQWEGDLVVGANGRSAVITLVERTSWFLILAPLTGRDSLSMRDAVLAAEINDRPRKIHRWKKPSEVFAELLAADASTP